MSDSQSSRAYTGTLEVALTADRYQQQALYDLSRIARTINHSNLWDDKITYCACGRAAHGDISKCFETSVVRKLQEQIPNITIAESIMLANKFSEATYTDRTTTFRVRSMNSRRMEADLGNMTYEDVDRVFGACVRPIIYRTVQTGAEQPDLKLSAALDKLPQYTGGPESADSGVSI